MGRILANARKPQKRYRLLFTAEILPLPLVLKNTTTGETLCDENHPIILESMELPGTCYPCCYRAENKSRSGKDGYCSWQNLLKKTRHSETYTDEETGQTIIAGMGELHLGNHR